MMYRCVVNFLAERWAHALICCWHVWLSVSIIYQTLFVPAWPMCTASLVSFPCRIDFSFLCTGFFFSGSLSVSSGCISTAGPSLFSATVDKRNVNKTFSLFVLLFLFFRVSSYKGSPLIFFFYPCVPKYTLILDFKTLPGREIGCYSQTLSLTEVFTMMCVDWLQPKDFFNHC